MVEIDQRILQQINQIQPDVPRMETIIQEVPRIPERELEFTGTRTGEVIVQKPNQIGLVPGGFEEQKIADEIKRKIIMDAQLPEEIRVQQVGQINLPSRQSSIISKVRRQIAETTGVNIPSARETFNVLTGRDRREIIKERDVIEAPAEAFFRFPLTVGAATETVSKEITSALVDRDAFGKANIIGGGFNKIVTGNENIVLPEQVVPQRVSRSDFAPTPPGDLVNQVVPSTPSGFILPEVDTKFIGTPDPEKVGRGFRLGGILTTGAVQATVAPILTGLSGVVFGSKQVREAETDKERLEGFINVGLGATLLGGKFLSGFRATKFRKAPGQNLNPKIDTTQLDVPFIVDGERVTVSTFSSKITQPEVKGFAESKFFSDPVILRAEQTFRASGTVISKDLGKETLAIGGGAVKKQLPKRISKVDRLFSIESKIGEVDIADLNKLPLEQRKQFFDTFADEFGGMVITDNQKLFQSGELTTFIGRITKNSKNKFTLSPTKSGRSSTQSITVTKTTPGPKTEEGFQLFVDQSGTKDVTRSLGRKTVQKESSTRLVAPEQVIENEGVAKFITPANIEKTPLSQTFAPGEGTALTSQFDQGIAKVLPKPSTPKVKPVSTTKETTTTGVLLSGTTTAPIITTTPSITIPAITANVLTPDIGVNTTPDIGLRSVTDFAIRSDSDILQSTGQGLDLEQGLILQNAQDQSPILTSGVIPALANPSALKQDVPQSTFQIKFSEQIQKSIITQVPRTPRKPPIRIPVRLLPPVIKPTRTAKKLLKLRKEGTGVDVVVGQKTNRQKTIARNVHPFTGSRKGRKFVDRNIEASYKLVPTGRKAVGKKTKPFNVGTKFRASRRDPLFIVEKRKFRLDSSAEKKQIKQLPKLRRKLKKR